MLTKAVAFVLRHILNSKALAFTLRQNFNSKSLGFTLRHNCNCKKLNYESIYHRGFYVVITVGEKCSLLNNLTLKRTYGQYYKTFHRHNCCHVVISKARSLPLEFSPISDAQYCQLVLNITQLFSNHWKHQVITYWPTLFSKQSLSLANLNAIEESGLNIILDPVL